jgi:hypothetical protein
MSFNPNEEFLSFQIPDLESFFNQILSPEALETAMKAALDEIEAQLKLGFQIHQQEWKPLALSTQYQRTKQSYNPTSPILVRSGTLRNNIGKGREIAITATEIRGDVYPFDNATTPYSDTQIGDYLEALNKVREFYFLDETQMDLVYGKFVEVLSAEIGLT